MNNVIAKWTGAARNILSRPYDNMTLAQKAAYLFKELEIDSSDETALERLCALAKDYSLFGFDGQKPKFIKTFGQVLGKLLELAPASHEQVLEYCKTFEYEDNQWGGPFLPANLAYARAFLQRPLEGTELLVRASWFIKKTALLTKTPDELVAAETISKLMIDAVYEQRPSMNQGNSHFQYSAVPWLIKHSANSFKLSTVMDGVEAEWQEIAKNPNDPRMIHLIDALIESVKHLKKKPNAELRVELSDRIGAILTDAIPLLSHKQVKRDRERTGSIAEKENTLLNSVFYMANAVWDSHCDPDLKLGALRQYWARVKSSEKTHTMPMHPVTVANYAIRAICISNALRDGRAHGVTFDWADDLLADETRLYPERLINAKYPKYHARAQAYLEIEKRLGSDADSAWESFTSLFGRIPSDTRLPLAIYRIADSKTDRSTAFLFEEAVALLTQLEEPRSKLSNAKLLRTKLGSCVDWKEVKEANRKLSAYVAELVETVKDMKPDEMVENYGWVLQGETDKRTRELAIERLRALKKSGADLGALNEQIETKGSLRQLARFWNRRQAVQTPKP